MIANTVRRIVDNVDDVDLLLKPVSWVLTSVFFTLQTFLLTVISEKNKQHRNADKK
jgi:hypothetical protein